MNEALKQKRDDLAVRPRDGHEGTTHYYSEEFQAGFDAALKAVTEMIGEFDEPAATIAIDSGIHRADAMEWISAMHGAKWQHAEIMKKLEVE